MSWSNFNVKTFGATLRIIYGTNTPIGLPRHSLQSCATLGRCQHLLPMLNSPSRKRPCPRLDHHQRRWNSGTNPGDWSPESEDTTRDLWIASARPALEAASELCLSSFGSSNLSLEGVFGNQTPGFWVVSLMYSSQYSRPYIRHSGLWLLDWNRSITGKPQTDGAGQLLIAPG